MANEKQGGPPTFEEIAEKLAEHLRRNNEYRERCPVHLGEVEPCPTCAAYIAAGL